MNRRIKKLCSELCLKYNISENFDSEEDSEDDSEESIILKCTNCNRRNIKNCSPIYELHLQSVSINDIKGDRPFTYLSGTRSASPIEYQLFHQCSIHLTNVDNKKATDSKYTWPDIYWHLIQSKQLHERYNHRFI